MKKYFEIETPFTYEVYERFNRFHLRMATRRTRLLCLAVGAALAGAGAVLIWQGWDDRALVAFCLVVGAVLVLAGLLPPRIDRRQLEKMQQQLAGQSATLTFWEEELQVQSGQAVVRVAYDALYRCYETGDAFYLYPHPSNAYIVDKQRLPPSEVEQLRSFLQQKTGGKLFPAQG